MRRVSAADASTVANCASVLAAGFLDDPVHSFIWPDRERRAAVLPRFFEASLRCNHLLGGGVYAAGTGVAVWDPPGWRQPLGARIRSAPQLLSILRTRLPAALAVEKAMAESHPPQPCWLLNNLATVERGKGVGSALVHDKLEQCDAAGIDTYLVCTRESTIPFYEHFGYKVTAPVPIPAGPTLWGMLRYCPRTTTPSSSL